MRLLGLSLIGSLLWVSPALAGMAKTVYKKAGPAVVLILGSDDGKAGSGGTGSIVTPEGKVVTNAHVVVNERGRPFKILYVFLKPNRITGDNSKDLGRRFKARVLDFSPADQLDLALLQIEDAPAGLPTISFADPDKVEVGDEVVAIGHPEQGGLWTLTTGTISTVIANFGRVNGKHVFQTEASVNRGNSGGPLLDERGDMVGVNTMIARQGAGGVTITDVNFSLKSSVAVSWLAGAGLGLAYSPPRSKQQVVVAMAPEPAKPAAAQPLASESPAAPVGPQTVAKAPAATIVVAEAPPPAKQVQSLRTEGEALGKRKEAEKVVAGRKLDPKKARPKYHTRKRPYSIDELRRKQMKELEEIMDDARGKISGKRSGSKFDDMGL